MGLFNTLKRVFTGKGKQEVKRAEVTKQASKLASSVRAGTPNGATRGWNTGGYGFGFRLPKPTCFGHAPIRLVRVSTRRPKRDQRYKLPTGRKVSGFKAHLLRVTGMDAVKQLPCR